MTVHVFGIRHHGPGCARSLEAALRALEPDCVLVEGPPDAEDVLPLAAKAGMKPPIALLVYPADAPKRASFYPFAEHSPEWRAIRYGLAKGVPVRFMDLPLAHALAVPEPQPQPQPQPQPEPDAPAEAPEPPEAQEGEGEGEGEDELGHDPIGLLSQAAGYEDRELWWEIQIEQRLDATGLFEGILEAMTALRPDPTARNEREARREAYMRRTIRAAQKEGFQRIAVVCGAWHAPALVADVTQKADDAVLKGLPKVKTAATWIPWTRSRLSYRSGYGAGVQSPGWYQHLWEAPDRAPMRWIAQAAQLLRAEDLDASSASVIEAVRLADALAAMRGLPMPGLAELREAILTVLCHGEPAKLAIIREKLEIGEQLGEVPEDAPTVPLQRDLEAQQKTLRLKVSPEAKPLELDLREEGGRERSKLLHRLRLLDVPWGELQRDKNVKGTFKEAWTLAWKPEIVVQLVERSPYGHTVATAAAAYAAEQARDTDDLGPLCEILDQTLLAGLPEAAAAVLGRVQERSAALADVPGLIAALPPLARVARYGDVRGTDAGAVLPVYDGIFERVVVGLPGACASLDDAAAAAMTEAIGKAHETVGLLDRAGQRAEWHDALGQIAERGSIHGLVRGYATRLLFEGQVIDADGLHARARLALSPAEPPTAAAAWIEGLLKGSALLLLHQDPVWVALDGWLAGLAPDVFEQMLPLIRRAFSEFHAPERQKMGEKVRDLRGAVAKKPKAAADVAVHEGRAARVLPVLAHILSGERLAQAASLGTAP